MFQGEFNSKFTPLLREYCQEQDWGRLSDLLSWMETQVRRDVRVYNVEGL